MIRTLLQWVRSLRRQVWRRWRVPYWPARRDWAALVREVSRVTTQGSLWVGADGTMGAPLEWSLLRRESGRLVTVEATCAWTGEPTTGDCRDPEGQAEIGKAWGVRCARCGVPIRVTVAGMRHSVDIPSCPPCRPLVKRVAR